MRRVIHRARLAVLLVLLAACGGRGPAAPAASARRIVSLSPATTELLFALGAGERVVGRTTWCDYPPEAQGVPSVGDGLNPSLESIVARRPDLVVLYRSPLNETAARQLGSLGIGAVVLPQDRLEDLARAARTLGRLTGRTAAGDSIAARIDALVARPAPDLRVSLAFIVWDNPLIVIGGESYLDQIATLAGATNAFHDLPSASSVVSLETLAARDPDVLITLSDSTPPPGPPSFARRREWQAVRAARTGRFVALTGPLFGRPSPRAALAVAELRRLLGGARQP
jgi:iron complex transport system substrate-binding protein